MFHTKINPYADATNCVTGEIALRAFLSSRDTALGHAAVLLADRRGAKLINAIRDGLNQPGSITRRLRFLLLDLRSLLFLEHAHDDDLEDAACFAMLDPGDPIVPEICLLADSLDEALRRAGVSPVSDDRAA